MGDGVAHEVSSHQMLNWPSLATVRSEGEGVEAAGLPQLVEDRDVGKHVVRVVGVRRVLATIPLKVINYMKT